MVSGNRICTQAIESISVLVGERSGGGRGESQKLSAMFNALCVTITKVFIQTTVLAMLTKNSVYAHNAEAENFQSHRSTAPLPLPPPLPYQPLTSQATGPNHDSAPKFLAHPDCMYTTSLALRCMLFTKPRELPSALPSPLLTDFDAGLSPRPCSKFGGRTTRAVATH